MDKRVQVLNGKPMRPDAQYVLCWAQMNRRVDSNHALAYAAELANKHQLPVLFYEGLTCTYPHANDRIHTFMLEAVPETARRLKAKGIGYCFYLRKRKADANDVLYKLAKDAAAIVTDDYPTFVARWHNESVPGKVDVPYFAVDSSCVVPMAFFEKREYAAYTIRPKVKRVLEDHMHPAPEVKVSRKWTGDVPGPHTEVNAGNIAQLVSKCEIDHEVKPSLSFRGGRVAAERHLNQFLEKNLRRYARERNEPAAHATSDLSPYLHFGYINATEVALAVREYAKEHKLVADEFLEELIVRRELAFNYARFTEQPDQVTNLPDWAQGTLRKHATDKRDPQFSREQIERAETYDALWNATQKEMLLRGKIHGYYRMYWGKKIIEWSQTYQDAVDTMVYLHDKYALDGRDPNTYTNILWCLGLHDRPWAERPIFGMIRYMSYDGMKRKTNTEAYQREIRHIEETGNDPFKLAYE